MNTTNQLLRKNNDEKIEAAEIGRDRIIDTVGVYGPLAIPLVPAGLTLVSIGVNYAKLLHFPPLASWPTGFVSGVGVEIFGIIANENYLDMVRYNQTLQPGEEAAPVEEAKDARDLYVKIVIGLLSTLEFIPALAGIIAHYAAGWEAGMQIISTVSVLLSLFPLAYLAVLTSRVIIMRKQHKARLRARLDRHEAAGKESVIEQMAATIDGLEKQLVDAQLVIAESEGLVKRSDEVLKQKDLHIKTLEIELDGLRRIVDYHERQPRSAVSGVLEPLKEPESAKSKPVSVDKRRVEVLKILASTNKKTEINFANLGRTFGTSDTTIKKDLAWLIDNEYWLNGEDWKPTEKGLGLLGEVVASQ